MFCYTFMSKKLTQSEAGKLGNIAAQITFAKQKQKRIDNYNKNPKFCQYCGNPISYDNRRNGKFCSQSCFAFNKNKYSTKTVLDKQCKTCVNKFPTTYENRAVDHCTDCIKNLSYRITYKNAKNITQLKTDAKRRMFLIHKLGHYCHICKNTSWNNVPIPLELDHIDGNSENNIEENLRVICPNCHTLTVTYKGKNKGKGRTKRMEKYNEKKNT